MRVLLPNLRTSCKGKGWGWEWGCYRTGQLVKRLTRTCRNGFLPHHEQAAERCGTRNDC